MINFRKVSVVRDRAVDLGSSITNAALSKRSSAQLLYQWFHVMTLNSTKQSSCRCSLTPTCEQGNSAWVHVAQPALAPADYRHSIYLMRPGRSQILVVFVPWCSGLAIEPVMSQAQKAVAYV